MNDANSIIVGLISGLVLLLSLVQRRKAFQKGKYKQGVRGNLITFWDLPMYLSVFVFLGMILNILTG